MAILVLVLALGHTTVLRLTKTSHPTPSRVLMGYTLQSILEVLMPPVSSAFFIVYAMKHWTTYTIGFTCILLAVSTISSVNSLFRGIHRIKKHRDEMYAKSKILECSWKNQHLWSKKNPLTLSKRTSPSLFAEYIDDDIEDMEGSGIELGVVRRNVAMSVSGVLGNFAGFSKSNTMRGDIADDLKEANSKSEGASESQWHALLSGVDLLEYEQAFIDSEVSMILLLKMVAPKSANSPLSKDIAELLPILKEIGVTKVGHAMRIAQAVRKLRH